MEAKVFYAKSANLICYPERPQRIFENGQSAVLEGSKIEFSPQADGFGRYVTDEAKEIAYLEKRAREVGDILTPEMYSRETTPPEVRNAQLERHISTQNSLIAQLQEKIAKQEGAQPLRK